MPIRTLIKRSEYHDSVTLMLAAREVSRLPGVSDVAVVMGTEANKSLLRNAGLLTPEAEAATPNDLVVAIQGTDEAIQSALAETERNLQKKETGGGSAEFRPKTLHGAVKASPSANFAVISVAGRYAADEAWDALLHGLHVLLFSDNVSLKDELALKQYAVEHGLLLMGPGAGTAILNGVALGFANVLPTGPVGIVSAAGTGLQEVSTLLARHGVGITQGIGTGGRDLQEAVGGLMMLAGLRALQADPATRLTILVSKPPAASIAQRVLDQVAQSEKPAVVCFLGSQNTPLASRKTVWFAHTLEEAALLGVQIASQLGIATLARPQPPGDLTPAAVELRSRLRPGQRYLRGLYSGGTLCYEAQVIWQELLSAPVLSNAPLDQANLLPDSTLSQGHTAVDLGEEEFTVGRPHPIIDNDLRIRRLLQEAQDPEVAVVLLDSVLGYGAHPNPAAELGEAVRQARQLAFQAGGELIVIASVTGTEADPQCLSLQERLLREAGCVVRESNAAAARLAAKLIQD